MKCNKTYEKQEEVMKPKDKDVIVHYAFIFTIPPYWFLSLKKCLFEKGGLDVIENEKKLTRRKTWPLKKRGD